MFFFPFFRVRGIHSRRRTILSLNTKTSLGGYEPADGQRYHVISYPNHKTRKKTSTMRKLFGFFRELYLMCMICMTGTSFVRICVEKQPPSLLIHLFCLPRQSRQLFPRIRTFR